MKRSKISALLNRFGMPVTLMLFGLLLLVFPDSAAILIAKVLGWILSAAGMFSLIAALSSSRSRVSKGIGAAVCLLIGSTLLAQPLLLAKNIGRFLGVLLAIEGGNCMRKDGSLMGAALLAAAAGLVFAPITLSRIVFSMCGAVVLVIGIVMFISRTKERRYLEDGGDPNIIDAL